MTAEPEFRVLGCILLEPPETGKAPDGRVNVARLTYRYGALIVAGCKLAQTPDGHVFVAGLRIGRDCRATVEESGARRRLSEAARYAFAAMGGVLPFAGPAARDGTVASETA